MSASFVSTGFYLSSGLVTILNFKGYGCYGYREIKAPFGYIVVIRWGNNFHFVIWLQLPTGIESKRLVTSYNEVITVITACESAACYIINNLVIWLQLLP